MSAFDIAGAAAAVPLSAFCVGGFISTASKDDTSGEDLALGIAFCVATVLWAAFCLARIAGASL